MTNARKQGSQETDHNDKLSVYEFSFDPDEEPPPPATKSPKRKVIKKKPKPKIVIFKDSYNKNLSKSLANLKEIVNKNHKNENRLISTDSNVKVGLPGDVNKNDLRQTIGTTTKSINQKKIDNSDKKNPLDLLEVSKLTPRALNHSHTENLITLTTGIDTLKQSTELLQQQSPICKAQSRPDDQSFLLNYQDFSFDEQPTASSSFLHSPRRPNATPWRLQWEAPASKWPINMYVKSNMTPAYESNFSNVDIDKGSRRYPVDIEINTHHGNDENMCEEPNKLVQTSILSFIQEVATKRSKKKNKLLTDAKHDVSFDKDTSGALCPDHFFTPEKTDAVVIKPHKLTDELHATKVERVKKWVLENDESPPKAHKNDKKTNQVPVKEKIFESPEETPQKRKHKDQAKTPNKRKKTDNNFGFDLDDDQENLSPTKESAKSKPLRPRTANVLKEINSQNKSLTSSEIFIKNQDEIPQQMNLSDEDLSTIDKDSKTLLNKTNPSKNLAKSIAFDCESMEQDQMNDRVDGMSPVLFDDVDIVHHNQPVRKSYGKGVKLSESKMSTAASVLDSTVELDSDEDLGFVQPILKENTKAKKKKVHKISKKEVEEADKWANSFNSMCEDIEDFDLIIE